MPLVFVPTPLGNLRDVTLRALDALREAELIVAEDTRVARKLLHALQLEGREIWSYREQNAQRVTPAIVERARTALVAVTSDAGMPGISDPGSALVAAARAGGVSVEVLPGPSAAMGVALLSGFPLQRFSFEGFPPRTSGERRTRFSRAMQGRYYDDLVRVAATHPLCALRPRRRCAGCADLRRARVHQTSRATFFGNCRTRRRGASRSGDGGGCVRRRALSGRRGRAHHRGNERSDRRIAGAWNPRQRGREAASRARFRRAAAALRAGRGAEGAAENLD